MMRIGHGFDAHKFGCGDHVIIGGARIEHTFGLAAHSDGDVLIHALCDALLGAAGWGDIGKHFPDSDAEYENIDSRVLLRRVVQKLHASAWCVANIDSTIVAQAPRMAAYIPTMRSYLAADLEVELSAVNVKATTTEGMGFTGREEGIAAHAVALLVHADIGA
jgi:2-C-methyl-D-erythritol 2,4-cyclodiphosphate synthase